MLEVRGKNNTAIVYTDELEDVAKNQIQLVCDQAAFADSKIRMMSDVHAEKGCCIGTTMTITDKVVPSMVGVDIGCGMEVVGLENKAVDFQKLDNIIRKNIPFGMTVRSDFHPYNERINLTKLRCFKSIKHVYAQHSLGSLGGGNHFIEIDKDNDENLYLVIHSGSRHLGTEVAEFYQEEGLKYLKGCTKSQLDEVIIGLKKEGRQKEIQGVVEALENIKPTVDVVRRILPVYNFKANE